jgi:hypothetical protein
MASFIRLTQVVAGSPTGDGEDEGVGLETTRPIVINVDRIHSIRPRNEGLVGTRVQLVNGMAVPVTELFHEVTRHLILD